jgi:hypothetical protein
MKDGSKKHGAQKITPLPLYAESYILTVSFESIQITGRCVCGIQQEGAAALVSSTYMSITCDIL